MELFEPNGHLTDESLSALVFGELEELSRLEIAEHLSYCNCCLDRYLELLSDDALETPACSCRKPLLNRIRKETLHILSSRLATAAAAIVIVVSLWSGGVFGALVSLPAKLTSIPTAFSQSIEAHDQTGLPATDTFFARLGGWIDGTGSKGQTIIGGK